MVGLNATLFVFDSAESRHIVRTVFCQGNASILHLVGLWHRVRERIENDIRTDLYAPLNAPVSRT